MQKLKKITTLIFLVYYNLLLSCGNPSIKSPPIKMLSLDLKSYYGMEEVRSWKAEEILLFKESMELKRTHIQENSNRSIQAQELIVPLNRGIWQGKYVSIQQKDLLLIGDTFQYNNPMETIEMQGNVSIIKEYLNVHTDELSYNGKTDIVTLINASGSLS